MIKEENDAIELFKLMIEEKGQVHQILLAYLGISSGMINKNTMKENTIEEIYQFLKERFVLTNKSEFRDLLETISHLCKKNQTKKEIKNKIENLIITLKADMISVFPEKELYEIFHLHENNYILLILVEHNILPIENIVNNINLYDKHDWLVIRYFYPEILKYNRDYCNEIIDRFGEELQIDIEMNEKNPELFKEIRKEGTKGSRIIEMIREDKVEEFISFVEHSSLDINQKIHSEGLFSKTKYFTPIKYSALFGSLAIFKYLYLKEAYFNIIAEDENNNIIECAIQGRNYEIIHILEERKEIRIELNNKINQLKYLKKSIKMHYNEIFEYLITNYNIQITKEVIEIMIIYRNYLLLYQLIARNEIELGDKSIMTNIFFYICKNGNEEIVKILINQPNIDINLKEDIFDH